MRYAVAQKSPKLYPEVDEKEQKGNIGRRNSLGNHQSQFGAILA